MQILKSISVDFGNKTISASVYAKRYDAQSRFLEIQLCSDGRSFEIDDDVTALMQLVKPDGKVVVTECETRYGGARDKLRAEFTKQALAAAGIATAEIVLYQNDEVLSSQKFYIEIEEAALTNAFESTNELRAMDSMMDRVDTAVSEAEGAARDARTAAADAENMDIAAAGTPTGADITVTDRNGVQTTVHIDTLLAVNTWNDIRNAVRMGYAPALFPAGHEFITHNADTDKDIAWVVRGHNHHAAVNGRLTKTMTLECRYVRSGANDTATYVHYDAPEALYHASEKLEPGDYTLTVAGQTVDKDKTFGFTLTRPLPEGGQLCINGDYNQAFGHRTLTSYSSGSSTDAIETAVLTEVNYGGSASHPREGTSLGVIGSGNFNNLYRVFYGNNNYAQSALRQWCNSTDAAGSVWTPASKFDRPPSWAGGLNGFAHGLPADFLAVVQPAAVPYRTNSIWEADGSGGTVQAVDRVYNLNDSFFPLSRPEIYGTYDDTDIRDGEQLDYYNGLADAERIKRDAGEAVSPAWLRGPTSGGTYYVRCTGNDGALGYNAANSEQTVAPACIIA